MEPFLGMIMPFAGNFEIQGWAFCDGRLLSISQYSALFAILGTIYGGDGVSTFALPDLRGRIPIGFGQGPGLPNFDLGEVGGSNQVTLTTANMAGHTHTMTANVNNATTTVPTNNYLGNIGAGNQPAFYSGGPPSVTMGPRSVGIAGSSQPVEIQQPYLALNYIIALEGIFPSRN